MSLLERFGYMIALVMRIAVVVIGIAMTVAVAAVLLALAEISLKGLA